MSELICPKSGEVCKFADFCGAQKSSSERTFNMPLFGFPEIEEVLAKAGFCADERISALANLASSHTASEATLTMAESIARSIISLRDAPPSDCRFVQDIETN